MIHSAKCTLAEIDMDEALLVNRKTTMKEALDAILKRKNKGVFVVDENNHLEGVVSTSNLTNLWTADEQALEDLMSRVPLENIIKTTKATLIYDAPFKPNGKVNLLPNLGYNNQIEPGTIVIAGNHPDIQRSVIEQKAALLIICGENWVDSITMAMAKEKQVPIIHTRLSAITIAHSIFQSPSIEEVMEYFHERGGIVVARDIYNRGEGMKDRVYSAKDSKGRGFDAIDTVSASRRRIDNEMSIEAQQTLGIPAVAGSGVYDNLSDIGHCVTMFAGDIHDQASFVAAMRSPMHWACALRDLGDACPMGAPPRADSNDDRHERRAGGRDDRRGRSDDRRGRSDDRRGRSDDRRGRSDDRRGRGDDRRGRRNDDRRRGRR
jgi:hypothetical protein